MLCYGYRGVAARALHLSRGVEKPSGRVTYVVVLEGLCRFSVQELTARGTYYTARVSRLDMTKAGKLSNFSFCMIFLYPSLFYYCHLGCIYPSSVLRNQIIYFPSISCHLSRWWTLY